MGVLWLLMQLDIQKKNTNIGIIQIDNIIHVVHVVDVEFDIQSFVVKVFFYDNFVQ